MKRSTRTYSLPPRTGFSYIVPYNNTKQTRKNRNINNRPATTVPVTGMFGHPEEAIAKALGTTHFVLKKIDTQGSYSSTFLAVAKKGSAAKRSHVLVKITDRLSGERESRILTHLRACPRIRACRGTLFPRKHVPILYESGPVQASPLFDKPGWVLVMEFIRSTSSANRRRPSNVDAAHLEEAIFSLWAAGVVHADLHKGNVLYTPNRAVIIDFGFAVQLPPTMHQRLVRNMCVNPDTAFEDPTLARYVQNKQSEYERWMMHWNINALRRVYSGGATNNRSSGTPTSH